MGVVLICMGCTSVDKGESDGKSEELFRIVNQADADYEKSRWFQASIGYQQVIERVPNDHYAYLRLANAQLRQGKIESAIANYEAALERDPKHAKTHFNLSIAYMLKSINALRVTQRNLLPSDPAHRLIEKRIVALKDLIDQPTEVAMSNTRQVFQYGGYR